ncbi:MAG TPA: Sec-independent protein translocase protein TatB [Sulfuricurvum sp.]|nr:MAG: twin arginine-targeting protein translocase TatB [Campylobacterales bacterium 16-40-21]OZA02435.1 MAG: twin arginine-targeting protein translocase TatB [Sulfuricurvum sp. 17-40-25]HQS67569.1 Sec-independent protein translocase protein TatB [Sulfuricurvum sp.]HQT36716.1 Sec-independent protein translocase protein TatB [Sulfuricurvum sp.]
MFGMGLTEIFLIAIVAVLFLGPDKLPSTMIEIAKFFRSVKGTVNSAKATLEDEIRLSGIKESVMDYKTELKNASSELTRMTDLTDVKSEITAMGNDLLQDTSPSAPAAPKEPEAVTFVPKNKEDV